MNLSDFEWSIVRQRQLVELARRGHTASEIAAKMGITRNAVIGRAYRTDVDLPWTEHKLAMRRRGRPRHVAPISAETVARALVASARAYGDDPVRAASMRAGVGRRSVAAAVYALKLACGIPLSRSAGLLGIHASNVSHAVRGNCPRFNRAVRAAHEALAE